MNHDSPTFVDVDKLTLQLLLTSTNLSIFRLTVTETNFETDSMPGDGEKEDAGDISDRGKDFCFPELMYCLFAYLGANEKFSADKPKPVRLQDFNDVYMQRVKWMKVNDKWRDQHVKRVTHITPEQSIQERIKEISKIPTGKQVSDVQEALRVAYFNVMSGDNAPDPFSSEDEAGKADRVEVVSTARANKFDKFHPMDLYLYFHFGPASVGGCDSPYFLETATDLGKLGTVLAGTDLGKLVTTVG